MTGTTASERLLRRLLVARWNDEEAEWRHFSARRRLASEFLRRKAVWAHALGETKRWPFSDIALLCDPSAPTDPVCLERVEAAVGHELEPMVRKVIADMFRWVSLADRPYRRFPEFDDLYEPMVRVFELAGQFWQGGTSIELPVAGPVYLSLAARLTQEPIPIDDDTLAQLDEEDRRRLDRRARGQVREATHPGP